MFWIFDKHRLVKAAIKRVMESNNITLEEAKKRKIEIIREVRKYNRIGLKDAKTLVDAYLPPTPY